MTLACEDAYSKLVEVVTVADIIDEDRVGNSLFQKLSYQLNRNVVNPADEFDGLCQKAASSLLNGS